MAVGRPETCPAFLVSVLGDGWAAVLFSYLLLI